METEVYITQITYSIKEPWEKIDTKIETLRFQ